MNYLKICKKHGKLTQDKITKNRKGILICKKCRNEQSEDWREKNKEKQKLKCLKLRELAKENKLIKTCKIHGKLEGKDILVNNRASRMCGICQRKKSLERYIKEKLLKPKSEYQILKEEKAKGKCKIHGENVRTKSGKQPCKICRQLSSERWRNKNPEKVKEINEKRRLLMNKGKYKENQKKRLEIRKNENLEGYRKIMAEKAREYRKGYPDAYIKQTIKMQRIFKKDGIKIPVENIPQEVIDIKRLHLQLKHKIKKEINNDN